jgi:hypothetical protein
MLKFANATLEILLEFGMHYPCQSLTIDKYACLFDVKLLFYKFKFFNMNFFYFFCLTVYYIYSKLFIMHSLLYIVN